jgi:hypothetical protein
MRSAAVSRLRELAQRYSEEDWTPDHGGWTNEGHRRLNDLLPDMAAMLVEIPDVWERDATQFAGLNAYLSEEERAAIRALLARIEELEGRA